MIYCFDASSLFRGWKEFYPPDIFPGFWRKLETMAAKGLLVCPEEVVRELRDDDLREWMLKHKASVVVRPTPAVQQMVRLILKSHARLIDTRTGRSGGDPWLVAVARVTNAVVVTEEVPSKPGTNVNKPKIPDVCSAYQVPFTDIVGFMRQVKWQCECE